MSMYQTAFVYSLLLLFVLSNLDHEVMGLSTFVQTTSWKKAAVLATRRNNLSHFLYFPDIQRRRRRPRTMSTSSRIVMMPEGPEVRTLVDQLQGGVGRRLVNMRFLSGRYVRHGPPEGLHEFAATMTKFDPVREGVPAKAVDVIQDWNCKGKFIYILFDNGTRMPQETNRSMPILTTVDPDFQRSMWITLGMSGRFVSETAHRADSRHARWYLELLDLDANVTKRIYYHDARNFGTVKFSSSREALATKLQSLGPDILDIEHTTEDDFVNIFSAQRPQMNICKFLMDQSKISGIGNYILAEGLYRATIDPFASLQEINEDQQRKLFRELRATAMESYQAQGLTRGTGGQYRNMDGDRGKFEFQLRCYGRDYCVKGNPVRKEVQGPHGRTIWYTDEQLFMPRSERAKRSIITRSMGDNSSNSHSKAVPDDDDDDANDDDEISGRKSGSLVQKEKASDLLSFLTDQSWKDALSNATRSESFQNLLTFLKAEQNAGATIYPPREEIFAALNLCPLENVKVVIVGQDPYHGPGQGHGLAFSVRVGVKTPPSLQNIFREAMNDVGIASPPHGNLEHWARQGVLLLNTVLTVRRGEANSHSKKGWEEFTDAVVDTLNEKRDDLVFLLWGNPAAKKASNVDETRHTIIRTSHPSPLGATKTSAPFLGSACFSRVNQALIDNGKEPIDWSVK